MSAPEHAVTDAPAPREAPRSEWRLSKRRLRRTLHWASLLGLLLLAGLIILLIGTVGFNNPPSWVVDVREYRITGRLTLIMVVLIALISLLSWVLGPAAAATGALALGGGAGTLRRRLRIARRSLRLTVLTSILLRLALLALLGVAAVYAYSRIFGPRMASGLPYTLTQIVGTNPLAVLLTIPLILAWIAGPVLRVRTSASLGALAATYTRGRPERVAYALGARFGAGLMVVLAGLWLWSGLLMIMLTVVDPVSYQSSVPFPSRLELGGVPLILIIASVGAVIYPLAQLFLAEVFIRFASARMRRKQKAAHSPRSSGLPSLPV